MRTGFKIFRKDRNWHPDGTDLLRYLDGEQSSGKANRIRLHLEACWTCRVEAEKIGQTISAFTDFRKDVLLPSLSPAKIDSAGFQKRLHALAVEMEQERRSQRFFRRRPAANVSQLRWRMAGLSTAVASVLLVAIIVTYLWSPVVNAQELLQHSHAADKAAEQSPDLVSHRSLRFEKRSYGSDRVLSRKRIDVWRNSAKGVTARRVYDESGTLVAGEWIARNGGSSLYKVGTAPKMGAGTKILADLLGEPEELWRLELSAGSFEELAVGNQARVEKRGDDYLVHFGTAGRSSFPDFLDAVLTVRKADLHVTEFDLTMRSGTGGNVSTGSAPVMYSIIEEGFERQPVAKVNPLIFQADAALVAAVTQTEEAAGADLQIHAMYLLDRIGATLGQEVTSVLSSDGKLHIEGIVDSEARKAEILTTLAPVRSKPAVVVKILTVAEAIRREPSATGATAIQRPAGATGSVPASATLQRYFKAQAQPPAEIPAAVQRYSQQALRQSGEAMRHAWVLKRIADLAPVSGLATLSPAARDHYLCMLRSHASSVEEHGAKLRLHLSPVFFAQDAAQEGPGLDAAPADLETGARRLFELVSRNDRAVQGSFTVTAGTHENAVSVQEIRTSLVQAEKLAAWIRGKTGTKSCDPGRTGK